MIASDLPVTMQCPTRDARSFSTHWRQLAPSWRPLAFPRFALASLLAVSVFAAQAEVTAKDAWSRGTVAGQKSSGVFLTLTSSEDAKVVAVRTPVAKSAEIHHTMAHQGVMHMHAVEELELPAGKPVELKPGGHHVMLMGLAKPLAAGDAVPLTFTIEDAKGKRTTVEVKAAVRPLGQ